MLYFLVGAICVAIGLWIFLPLVRSSSQAAPTAASTNSEDRRDALLRSLKELDFDHSTGKIADEDYSTQRSELAAQTSRVLDEIEAQRNVTPNLEPQSLVPDELELEVLVMRARNKNARQTSSWQCSCGRTMSEADRFCASCGMEHVAARETVAN